MQALCVKLRDDALAAQALGVELHDLARPDLVIYLAGADPYRDDRLGRLALTFDGLAERDRSVFAHCQARRLPLAIAMAGGYARQIEDTVRIHTTTIRLAKALPGG